MPTTCKETGCNNNVFGGGYCKYHQYRRRMGGGDQHTRKPKAKSPINKESKKRKEESKTYIQVKKELRSEMVANGTYNCFFCGLPMGNHFEFHHLKGRDGSLYTDEHYLVPVHNECHVHKYHHYTVEQLLKEDWYLGFLSRLKAIDEQLYLKEKKKQFKADLFADED